MTSSCNLFFFFFGPQMSCFHFLYGCKKFLCAYVPHSHYPLICWQNRRLDAFPGLGTSTAIHKDVQVTLWYTAPGGRQLARTAVLYHLLRDFCTDVHSGGTSLHPHQREYGSPPPRSHQHLLLLFILLEDADIVFTIGFYFLKCYTLIGCVCVHVCTLGYMCGGRRTTVGFQGA